MSSTPACPGPRSSSVVGDVKQASLALSQSDSFYIPTPQWSWVDPTQSFVVRVHGDPAKLAPAIKAAIWSVDKDQPIVHLATMASLLEHPRLNGVLSLRHAV